MSGEEDWRAKLIETLPNGTQHWRIVRRRMMVKDYILTFMELYNQGLNDTKIGEALGFHPSTISGFRRRSGLPSHIRRMEDYKVRLVELHSEGLSDGKIGKALGFDRQTVGGFRRRLGLPANFNFWGKPGLDDEEKQRIRELHSKRLPISMIAEEIGRSDLTVNKFCKGEKLDTSMARGRRYRRFSRGEAVIFYLKEHGPTPQSILSKELGIWDGDFSRIAREMFEQIERLHFKIGGQRGRRKHSKADIYGDLGDRGPILALRDDPRIIDFVAEGINFKVETTQDARTLVQNLKKQIGTERARDVARRLGYEYGEDRMGTHPDARKKFTDEEFLDLYEKGMKDREIAVELGVIPSTVGNRRRSMKLPVNKLRKLVMPLDLLDQIERLNEGAKDHSEAS